MEGWLGGGFEVWMDGRTDAWMNGWMYGEGEGGEGEGEVGEEGGLKKAGSQWRRIDKEKKKKD